MLKQHLELQFRYNWWAWQQVFASVQQLDSADYHLGRDFFWGSIHGTLVHAMAAEHIWHQRSLGNSPTALLDPTVYADFNAVSTHWQGVNDALQSFVSTLSDADLQRSVSYFSLEGNTNMVPQAQILQHVINHATEHRSQLTPLLFKLSVPTIELDFVHYCLMQSCRFVVQCF